MADETRIKLIGAGLILATIVVGFLIFTQRFGGNKVTKQLDIPPVVQASPSPVPVSSPNVVGAQASATPGTQLTKGGQSLPATGFPVGLFAILSASAAIAGYGLRKFPK